MSYARRIQRNGASIIRPLSREGAPWVGHKDPALRAWMQSMGYATIEDIPAEEDYRPPTTCERCGARGVETHHWAPKEWFGKEEAERWPMGELCRTCHRVWHWAAERAAAQLTVRILKSKGLHRIAAQIEEAMKEADEDAA